jgi:hypothetical protein
MINSPRFIAFLQHLLTINPEQGLRIDRHYQIESSAMTFIFKDDPGNEKGRRGIEKMAYGLEGFQVSAPFVYRRSLKGR